MNFLQFLQLGANPYALKFLTSYEKVSGTLGCNQTFNMGKGIDINPCPFLVFDTDGGG